MKAEWTAEAKLPGAEGFSSVEVLCAELMHEIKGLESQTAHRWANSYGSRVWHMLSENKDVQTLGQSFWPWFVSARSGLCGET